MEIVNNTYVLYTCDEGYRFPDGQKQEMLDCRDSSVEVGRGMLQCLGLFTKPSHVFWKECHFDTVTLSDQTIHTAPSWPIQHAKAI